MRYFKAINSQRIVTLGDYSFKFEPAYRNAATGGSWGILQVEDEEAAEVLAAEARKNGVFEVTESEYVQAIQKKSSLNINLVKHNDRSQESARRAEVKKVGETSSAPSAESLDDFMAGPKEETSAETSATPSENDTQTPDKTPNVEAPEPTIAKESTSEQPATPKKQPAKKSAKRKSK